MRGDAGTEVVEINCSSSRDWYSVPLNLYLASKMSSGFSPATFISALHQAWSLTTNSTISPSSFSHRYSTSSRGRMGR